MERIVIGTRGSTLARTQTGMVAKMVEEICSLPVEIRIIKTEGDRIQDVPLHLVDGKGFFTKEIEDALLNEEIDLAVHSLKDLPTESPAGLTVAAIPQRERAEDILLVREDVADSSSPFSLPGKAAVGTSSKRRALQIKAMNPGVSIKELRGNVPTRIKKMLDGNYDAIVLAFSGYRRLGLKPEGYLLHVLPSEVMLHAPGQGALALQTRADDKKLIVKLEQLHHPDTASEVEAERQLLELLGGGCGMPLGVRATKIQDQIRIEALLGPEEWQLHDAPVFKRATSQAGNGLEAAKMVLDQLKQEFCS